MQVELDIYSGRPNPFWELDTGQSAELSRRLAALPPAEAGAAAPSDALGHRGLRVEPHGGPTVGDRLEIGTGAVQVTRPDGSTWLRADPGRSLERWLIGTGRGRIDPALHDMVAAAAAHGP